MRVAVVTTHPIQYYAPIFRELAQRVELHVFYGRNVTETDQQKSEFGVPFEWDIDLLSGYESSFLGPPSSASEKTRDDKATSVHRALRDGRFDAVLAIGWYQKVLLQAIVAAKLLRTPVLVRGDSNLGTPRSLFKRVGQEVAYPALLRVFNAALFVGERSKAFLRHYLYPASRLFYSPHCVDTHWFAVRGNKQARWDVRQRLGVGPATRLVLFAGKLVPRKRPFEVVDAVAGLRERGVDAQVLVAGAGELETQVTARAASRNVPIHLLGFQNQTQMPAVYAAADALVLPSDSETWGLVCNEALACGTPIVVADAVGCAPDLAGDGSVGRTFPLGDVDACASALLELFRDPPSHSEIEAVSARFSISSAVDGIVAALAAVVRAKAEQKLNPAFDVAK